MDILLIISAYTLFGISHSILASNRVKENIIKNAGNKIAFYRLFYNISSIIFFIAIIYILPKPSLVLFDLEFPYDIIILSVQIFGLIGILWSVKYIDLAEFIGTKQITRFLKNGYDVQDKDEKKFFIKNGPFQLTRHPIYFFSIIFLTFRPSMDLFYLTSLICIIGYFYIGSYFEENKMIEKFGQDYIEYKNEVPKIIPYKFWNVLLNRKR